MCLRNHKCALQVIDLSAPDLAPEGWSAEESPPHGPFTDTSVYELHVRDFSASDDSVPPHLKGKYLAFALVRCLLRQPVSHTPFLLFIWLKRLVAPLQFFHLTSKHVRSVVPLD